MSDPKPNFFAIIPADVRYDPDLTPNAKLLYGEITSLCNKSGHCWATNSYFADLYGLANSTISKLINSLVARKHLLVEYETCPSGEKRYLWIAPPSRNRVHPLPENEYTPFSKSRKGIIKSNNKKEEKTIVGLPEKPSRKKSPSELKDEKDKTVRTKCSNRIIIHLNEVAGKKFTKTDTNRANIMARLSEGHTYSDCLKVIDTKLLDPYFIQNPRHLNPQTLFRPGNFERYLNETPEEHQRETQSESASNPFPPKFTAPFETYVNNPSPARLAILYRNLEGIKDFYENCEAFTRKGSEELLYHYPTWKSFANRYLKYLIEEKSFTDNTSPAFFNIDTATFWGDFKKSIYEMFRIDLDYKIKKEAV